jgi:hypothetical protein
VFEAKVWTCQDIPQHFDHHAVAFSELDFEKTTQDDDGKLIKFSLEDKILVGSTEKQGSGSSNVSDKTSLQSHLSIFQGYMSLNIHFINN